MTLRRRYTLKAYSYINKLKIHIVICTLVDCFNVYCMHIYICINLYPLIFHYIMYEHMHGILQQGKGWYA